VAFRFGCNILVLDAKDDAWNALESLPSDERVIDVWWWDDSTSRLMLLLAYLMTRNEAWEDAKIRVLAVGQEKESEGSAMEELQEMLQEVRIEAEPEIVEDVNIEKIIMCSERSAAVFVPFRLKRNHLIGPFDGELDDLVSRLPLVLLALASEDIDLEAEPEDGKAGELAAALDDLSDAEKKAKKAEEEAAKALKEAEEKSYDLESVAASGADVGIGEQLEAAREAKKKADKALRGAAKALAKKEDAAKAAEELGAEPVKKEEEPKD
jgi:hypothetical protein